MRSAHLLALALSTAAAAQIPPQSVVVATSTTTSNTSLVSVDNTGRATLLSKYGRGTHTAVALDPAIPASLWALGSWPTTGTPPVGHYLLSGLDASKTGAGDGVTGVFGVANRCHVIGGQLLFTVSGSSGGLYARTVDGKSTVKIASIADAYDIAVRRGKIYVTRWSTGLKSSSIIEVDASVFPAQTRTVPISVTSGTAPVLFKAIGQLGWEETALYLVIGDSAGKLWFVDPDKSVGNAFTVTFGSSVGMAEAIMTHPDQSIGMVIATSSGLYAQTSYNTGGKPFWASTNPILDCAVLGGGAVTYGPGCAGKVGVPRHQHGLNSWPYLGNQKFTLEMDNGPATTSGVLVLGLSATSQAGATLPLMLAFMGAPSCYLNCSIDLQFAVATDSKGAIVLPAKIPSDTTLRGLHVYAQWGLFEKVNSAGLITSAGLRLTIR